MKHSRVDFRKYIVISVWHACNNDCTICMLADVKNSMPVVDFPRFRNIIIDIRNSGRFESIILSGAEITTFDALEEYARFVSSLGYFRKLQIQTNGRRLHDKEYLKRLIDSGVNEFFISLHGLEQTHDAITRVPGSFRETMEGIGNLAAYPVKVISNSVLTKKNYADIPRLMSLLGHTQVSEFHLWNFYPMEQEDTRDLVVGMKDFMPLLSELIAVIKPTGKTLVLKSFPDCIPADEPAIFDSVYPTALLPDVFWRKFDENRFGACRHRAACKDQACWGLSSAYVRKYGDERNLLSPIP